MAIYHDKLLVEVIVDLDVGTIRTNVGPGPANGMNYEFVLVILDLLMVRLLVISVS